MTSIRGWKVLEMPKNDIIHLPSVINLVADAVYINTSDVIYEGSRTNLKMKAVSVCLLYSTTNSTDASS